MGYSEIVIWGTPVMDPEMRCQPSVSRVLSTKKVCLNHQERIYMGFIWDLYGGSNLRIEKNIPAPAR